MKLVDALEETSGINVLAHPDAASLRAAMRAAGLDAPDEAHARAQRTIEPLGPCARTSRVDGHSPGHPHEAPCLDTTLTEPALVGSGRAHHDVGRPVTATLAGAPSWMALRRI